MMIRAGMVTLDIVLPHVDIGKDNNHIDGTMEVLECDLSCDGQRV